MFVAVWATYRAVRKEIRALIKKATMITARKPGTEACSPRISITRPAQRAAGTSGGSPL